VDYVVPKVLCGEVRGVDSKANAVASRKPEWRLRTYKPDAQNRLTARETISVMPPLHQAPAKLLQTLLHIHIPVPNGRSLSLPPSPASGT